MRRHGVVRLVGVLGLAIGVGVLLAAPAAAITPQDDFPAAYYGEVTINGEPAPAGTVIEVEIGGTVRGTITTEQSGAYGGPELTDRKLEVTGTSPADTEAPVSFYIDSPSIDRTVVDQPPTGAVSWQSGAHERVDLSVTVPTSPDSGGDGGDSSSGDDGGSGSDGGDTSTGDDDSSAGPGGGAPGGPDGTQDGLADDTSASGQTGQGTPGDTDTTAEPAPGEPDGAQGTTSDDTQFGLGVIPTGLVLLTAVVAVLVALAIRQQRSLQDDDVEKL